MSRIITILIVVLIIVVIAAGAAFWLLPSQPSPATTIPSSSEEPLFADTAVTPTPAPTSGRVFNVEVLRSTLYQSLNHQLIDNGSLPVQPPAAIGKANPFL